MYTEQEKDNIMKVVRLIFNAWGNKAGLRLVDCGCYCDLVENTFGKDGITRLIKFLENPINTDVLYETMEHDLMGLRYSQPNDVFYPRFMTATSKEAVIA